MPGPPMLQGPFQVPSFNGYIPRRLQPWIYLLFAFIFLMSGGIYGGAMSQVMGIAILAGQLNAAMTTTQKTMGINASKASIE